MAIKKAATAVIATCAVAAGIAAAPAGANTALFLGGSGGGILTPDKIAEYPHPDWVDTFQAVVYPASTDFERSIAAGVEALKTSINAPKPIVVQGVSQGALVISAYKSFLMSLPEDGRPDPAQVSFVMFGDPSNTHNGLAVVLPVLKSLLGLPGPAVDTPYDSVWIIREYDFFADFPDRPWNLLAVANALAGWIYVHSVYNGVDPASLPGVLVDTEVNSEGGRDTYVLVPTENLPLTMPLRQLGIPDRLVDGVDHLLRPLIDFGYDRRGYEPLAVEETVDGEQFSVAEEEIAARTEDEEEPTDVRALRQGPQVKSGNKFVPGAADPAPEPQGSDAESATPEPEAEPAETDSSTETDSGEDESAGSSEQAA